MSSNACLTTASRPSKPAGTVAADASAPGRNSRAGRGAELYFARARTRDGPRPVLPGPAEPRGNQDLHRRQPRDLQDGAGPALRGDDPAGHLRRAARGQSALDRRSGFRVPDREGLRHPGCPAGHLPRRRGDRSGPHRLLRLVVEAVFRCVLRADPAVVCPERTVVHRPPRRRGPHHRLAQVRVRPRDARPQEVRHSLAWTPSGSRSTPAERRSCPVHWDTAEGSLPICDNHHFPKYASSVAHQSGKPWSWTESFAAYGGALTLEEMKWITDFQFVRGINLLISGQTLLSTKGHYMGFIRPMFGRENHAVPPTGPLSRLHGAAELPAESGHARDTGRPLLPGAGHLGRRR